MIPRAICMLALSAVLLHGTQVYASAESLEQELSSAISEHGKFSKPAQRIRKELAEEYEANSQFAKAIPHLKDMLAVIDKKKGPGSSKAAKIAFMLGKNLRIVGQSNEAIQYLDIAIRSMEKELGERHIKTLLAKYNLARAYDGVGDTHLALPLMEFVIKEMPNDTDNFKAKKYDWQTWLAKMYIKVGRMGEAYDLLIDSRTGLENDYQRAGPGSRQLTGIDFQLAQYEVLRNNHAKAENILQRAYAEATGKLGKEHPLIQGVMNMLAVLYLEGGRYAEAETIQQQVYENRLQNLGEDSVKTIDAANVLATIFTSLEKYDQAERLLRKNLSIINAGDQVYYSKKNDAIVQLSRVLANKGNLAEAESLLIHVVDKPFAEQSIRPAIAYSQLGDIYIQQGKYDKALDSLKQALAAATRARGESHRITGNVHTLLGKAWHKSGNLSASVEHYKKAIHILTSLASGGTTESAGGLVQQEQLVQGALQGYMELLITASQSGQSLGFNATDEAFAMAETARGRSIQKALLGMGARAAAGNAELSDKVRREQDVRMQVGLLEEEIIEILGRKDADQQRDHLQDLNEKRADLAKQIHQLNEEIYQQFPAYGQLMNPQPATISSAQKLLANNETMLSYLVERDRTLLWAISKDNTTLHSIPVGKGKLTAMIKRLRKGLDVSAASLNDIPPYDTKLAYELYSELVAPAEAQLAKARHVIVVPSGPLLSLPFGALVSSNAKPGFGGVPFSGYKSLPWLATRYGISVMPTATVFVTLRNVSQITNAPKPFIGFGNPIFNPQVAAKTEGNMTQRGAMVQRAAVSADDIRQLPPLPETEQELIKIAGTLGADITNDLFLKLRARESQVKSIDLKDYRVVVFATHGLLSGELKGLDEPALALSPPEQATKDDNEGLLKMSEILGLKMNANWVVLSACNTASSDGSLHGEGLSGLARAFFYAGSRAMLVTLWPVETTSAQLMTTSLFEATRAQQGIQRAAALSAARKRLIEGPGFIQDGKEAFSYAHPMFWAAFIVVGEGGA